MTAAARHRVGLCPRVVGGVEQRIVTCGHTLPCPDHGDPIVRFISPASEPAP